MSRIRDPNLRHTLQFGIGLHHAGLTEDDKKIVEDLFEKVKIQVLISTRYRLVYLVCNPMLEMMNLFTHVLAAKLITNILQF